MPPKPRCWYLPDFAQSGGKLIDCQVLNKHTASLGAVEIPRRDYLDYLSYCGYRLPERFWVPGCYLGGHKCFQHIFCQDGIIAR
jgi:hypothetical protein